jgi:4-amino-4-deoxy-L-arabinose transferase-like glycosyltransferase
LKKPLPFIFIFIAIIIVYLIGLPIDVMDVDAAQYAGISSDMFKSGEYLRLYCKGNDYLDKPPFLFWISQPFFFIFGVHDWSFKLGSLLFICIGIYATYRLGKLLYNKETGLFAAVILATTQAWFLITQDVKTDGILASTIIYSVWQWKCFVDENRWKNLVGLSVGIAISMLTKGPIGLMVPVLIMACELVYTRKKNAILNWKYIVGLLIIVVALLPMLYGLYMQFDRHPGKVVSGGQVVNSGIRYFFWTQSFGRITGESVWKGNSSFLYFFPELTWSFLPWTLFIIQALIRSFRRDLKKNIIPLAGFILPFLALSLSRYKLSHYIFICYPFLALVVANYLVQLKWNLGSKFLGILFQVIAIAAIFFLGYCFQIPIWISLVISTTVIAMVAFIYIKKKQSYFFSIAVAAIGFNFFLTGFIYPALLQFQGSGKAAQEYVQQQPDKKIPLMEVGTWSFSMEFYAQSKVKKYSSLDEAIANEPPGEYWLYMEDKTFADLLSRNITINKQKEFKKYSVTRLQLPFIWPKTRDRLVSKTHLVKVYLP